MKRFLTLAVAILMVVACQSSAQEPPECGPTQTPWGTPCYIEADQCAPLVRSLFVVGAREKTIVRVVVDYSSRQDVSEEIIPWENIMGVLRLELNDLEPGAKRIRWYSKWIDDLEFPEVPVMDCWCEPTTGEIERCVNGVLDSTSP